MNRCPKCFNVKGYCVCDDGRGMVPVPVPPIPPMPPTVSYAETIEVIDNVAYVPRSLWEQGPRRKELMPA